MARHAITFIVVLLLPSLRIDSFSIATAAEEVVVDVTTTGTGESSATLTMASVDEDPWVAITNFIRSNIFGDDDGDDDDGDVDSIDSESVDVTGSTSTGMSTSPNIWESFRSNYNVDSNRNRNNANFFGRTNVPKQPAEQEQLDDIIKTRWNDFIQSLGPLPNPFIIKSDDSNVMKSHPSPTGHNDAASKLDNHIPNRHRYDALTELIESVSSNGHNQYNTGSRNQLSIPEMIDLFWNTIQNVHQQLEQTFKCVFDLIVPIINPFKFYYYMLEQEIIHNPVQKRRQHAYHTDVSLSTAVQISEGLYVSQLAYAKDCTTIKKYLQSFQNDSWILINCTTTPQPFQPAHFLAIRRQRNATQQSSGLNGGPAWNYTMDRYKNADNASSSFTSSTLWPTNLWDNLRNVLNMTNTDANNQNEKLEAMLVICGTKDMADMMSDALLKPTQYGNSTHRGLAHSGIYQSAMYIHTTYREFLETLVYQTNRSNIKLWVIGHSLGGGTAALACLEFNKPYNRSINNNATSSIGTTVSYQNINTVRNSSDMNYDDSSRPVSLIDAYALGFGTPAVLSKEYSEDARTMVTTIINDADCVPRMSGATLVNFLLNVTASNRWINEAQIDVQQLKDIIKQKAKLLPDDWIDVVMATIYDWITASDMVNDTMRSLLAEKVMNPELYPPGDCIHIYRDGTSWQSVYYPCHNFNTLEGVRNMIDDHLIPTGYYRSLLGYIRGLKNDMNWRFIPDLMEIPL